MSQNISININMLNLDGKYRDVIFCMFENM